eukprot:CAMPEP_0177559596 /NCGR_PEP_ID=MMETSP0369-20130122/70926_1 /TAXON_ID=447022 ORGANISM="Scrippsiella hangoei-like, Strain SHHI-4" /NCGR_SAMPLE_ID=MMETSP0369 /ASSEMBLY_ACC=CAM_ASM_000364 /LENGTH=35 /DNA_ID= /DNA_START= /DNA_END= /DNA_ORIENTATION=
MSVGLNPALGASNHAEKLIGVRTIAIQDMAGTMID